MLFHIIQTTVDFLAVIRGAVVIGSTNMQNEPTSLTQSLLSLSGMWWISRTLGMKQGYTPEGSLVHGKSPYIIFAP